MLPRCNYDLDTNIPTGLVDTEQAARLNAALHGPTSLASLNRAKASMMKWRPSWALTEKLGLTLPRTRFNNCHLLCRICFTNYHAGHSVTTSLSFSRSNHLLSPCDAEGSLSHLRKAHSHGDALDQNVQKILILLSDQYRCNHRTQGFTLQKSALDELQQRGHLPG